MIGCDDGRFPSKRGRFGLEFGSRVKQLYSLLRVFSVSSVRLRVSMCGGEGVHMEIL
jgi:hypothetical protein